MPNEKKTYVSYLIIDNLLKQSMDKSSLTKNKDVLHMAVNLTTSEYTALPLTSTFRLYCDLLRIGARSAYCQNTHKKLSEQGKIAFTANCNEIAEKYSEVFCELWEKPEEKYDDIETLSNCLYETNKILLNNQKIRPQFSNIEFSFVADTRPPGDFRYCTMKNITFNDVYFNAWESDRLMGSAFFECHFSMHSLCGNTTFEQTDSFENCTFDNIIDDFSTCLRPEFFTMEGCSPTDINNLLIENARENYSELKKRDNTISKLEQENRDLKDKLRLLQTDNPSSNSNTSSFFDPPRREERSISGNLLGAESICKIQSKRFP
ncbi:MAG: hypothetical protein AAGB33_00055 [Cellulomonas sp.]|nr:hypothetical protein [Rickettsiella sp.]